MMKLMHFNRKLFIILSAISSKRPSLNTEHVNEVINRYQINII